jgi:hypothetical protein
MLVPWLFRVVRPGSVLVTALPPPLELAAVVDRFDGSAVDRSSILELEWVWVAESVVRGFELFPTGSFVEPSAQGWASQ